MKTSEFLTVNQIYTRNELRGMFDIQSASLNNGIFNPKGHDSIWLFITEHKRPDQTQYSDHLTGSILHFDGQNLGRTDRLIIDHKIAGQEIILFYRKTANQYPDSGFQYKGIFVYHSHSGTRPTQFVLHQPLPELVEADLSALKSEESMEGGKKLRLTNHYERNPKLRAKAIEFHGTKCVVCGFDFEKFYGELGIGYIEVHHLKPISTYEEPTLVDYKVDMTVVCSNCHRMLHRIQDEPLSIEELKQNIRPSSD